MNRLMNTPEDELHPSELQEKGNLLYHIQLSDKMREFQESKIRRGILRGTPVEQMKNRYPPDRQPFPSDTKRRRKNRRATVPDPDHPGKTVNKGTLAVRKNKQRRSERKRFEGYAKRSGDGGTMKIPATKNPYYKKSKRKNRRRDPRRR